MQFYLTQDTTILKHGVDYENVGQDLKSQRWMAIQRRWNIMHVDSENYWPDNNSCSQTQKELEDCRLQDLAEDPHRIAAILFQSLILFAASVRC
jgi:hypothetical protein